MDEGGWNAHEVCRATPAGASRDRRGSLCNRAGRHRPDRARTGGGRRARHELPHLRRRYEGQGGPEARADRDRRDQHAGRPGPRRPELDEGRRARRQVRQHLPRRRPGSSARSQQVLHDLARRRTGRSAARSSRTTSASRSSCSAPSPSATSRSTPRSAARSRSSAASRSCRSTRSRRTGSRSSARNDSVLGPWGTFAKTKLNAKTAAVVYPQVPGIDVGAKVEKTSLEAAGIDDEAGRLRRRTRPTSPAR